MKSDQLKELERLNKLTTKELDDFEYDEYWDMIHDHASDLISMAKWAVEAKKVLKRIELNMDFTASMHRQTAEHALATLPSCMKEKK